MPSKRGFGSDLIQLEADLTGELAGRRGHVPLAYLDKHNRALAVLEEALGVLRARIGGRP